MSSTVNIMNEQVIENLETNDSLPLLNARFLDSEYHEWVSDWVVREKQFIIFPKRMTQNKKVITVERSTNFQSFCRWRERVNEWWMAGTERKSQSAQSIHEQVNDRSRFSSAGKGNGQADERRGGQFRIHTYVHRGTERQHCGPGYVWGEDSLCNGLLWCIFHLFSFDLILSHAIFPSTLILFLLFLLISFLHRYSCCRLVYVDLYICCCCYCCC